MAREAWVAHWVLQRCLHPWTAREAWVGRWVLQETPRPAREA
jgi:hypothetical protein